MTGLAISLNLKKNRISIYKSTLQYLGNPTYISMIVNPEEYSLCVLSSSREDKTAHRVQPRNINSSAKEHHDLYSKSFVSALRTLCPEWQEDALVQLTGEAIMPERMVRFSLKKSGQQIVERGVQP